MNSWKNWRNKSEVHIKKYLKFICISHLFSAICYSVAFLSVSDFIALLVLAAFLLISTESASFLISFIPPPLSPTLPPISTNFCTTSSFPSLSLFLTVYFWSLPHQSSHNRQYNSLNIWIFLHCGGLLSVILCSALLFIYFFLTRNCIYQPDLLAIFITALVVFKSPQIDFSHSFPSQQINARLADIFSFIFWCFFNEFL